MKRFFSHTILSLAMAVALLPIYNASGLEVSIPAQIISTNTTWGDVETTYQVQGLIQIPRDVTLTVGPGTILDASKGSFLILGNLIIGSASGARTEVKFGRNSIENSSSGQSISIVNANISGDGSPLFTGGAPTSIYIDNSNISEFSTIFASTEFLSSITFLDNTVSKVSYFYLNFGMNFVYDVNISNNSFLEIQNIGGESPGIYVDFGQAGPSYTLVGNYFENNSSILKVLIPQNIKNLNGYSSLKLSNNLFFTPKNVVLKANGNDFSQNYWNEISSESDLRINAKIMDGKSDITLPIITLTPLLTTQPSIQVSLTRLITMKVAAADKAAAELKAKQDAEMKAAAELKAKQDAEMKAAAELKAKQDAEAKVAADKAAAELKAKQEADLKAKQDADAKEVEVLVTNFKKRIQSTLSNLRLRLLAIKNLSTSDRNKSEQLQKDLKLVSTELTLISGIGPAISELDNRTTGLVDQVIVIEARYKKKTITCIKGKTVKKVTAVKPVCPKGYKKK